MAEYIEKQAVMDKFAEVVAPANNSDFQRAPTWNDAVGIVEGFPPADVRPVEVGLWLRVGNTGLASCRCGFITDRYSTYRYCPNCGRKNEGVEYGG